MAQMAFARSRLGREATSAKNVTIADIIGQARSLSWRFMTARSPIAEPMYRSASGDDRAYVVSGLFERMPAEENPVSLFRELFRARAKEAQEKGASALIYRTQLRTPLDITAAVQARQAGFAIEATLPAPPAVMAKKLNLSQAHYDALYGLLADESTRMYVTSQVARDDIVDIESPEHILASTGVFLARHGRRSDEFISFAPLETKAGRIAAAFAASTDIPTLDIEPVQKIETKETQKKGGVTFGSPVAPPSICEDHILRRKRLFRVTI